MKTQETKIFAGEVDYCKVILIVKGPEKAGFLKWKEGGDFHVYNAESIEEELIKKEKPFVKGPSLELIKKANLLIEDVSSEKASSLCEKLWNLVHKKKETSNGNFIFEEGHTLHYDQSGNLPDDEDDHFTGPDVGF